MTRRRTSKRTTTKPRRDWQQASPWLLAQMIADALDRGAVLFLMDRAGHVQQIARDHYMDHYTTYWPNPAEPVGWHHCGTTETRRCGTTETRRLF